MMRAPGLALVCALLAALPASGAVIRPDGDAALADALARAQPGDEIILSGGRWSGPLTISTPLTLRGEDGAVIDAGGQGHVIEVAAPDVTIRDLVLTGSGRDLDRMDSAVFLTREAARAVVEGNEMTGNLHGVRVQGARDAMVRDNRIDGGAGRQADLGNGVSVWNAPGAAVEGNHITRGRDGIYIQSSRQNAFRDNRIERTRFAIHYMYAHDSEISGNISVGNTVGYAIMFSDRLVVTGNLSDDDRDYGFLFNTANRSTLTDNRVIGHPATGARWLAGGQTIEDEPGMPTPDTPAQTAGQRIAPEKCVFIYNANNNRFTGNHFEGCAIGIHFTAGAEGNRMAENNFVNNRIQVKYVGTRFLEWSQDGRGNYWSDNAAFDLDGDGIADGVYRPNDMIDKVMWTAPQARLLMTSPSVQMLRWAQSRFPAVLPGGVTDSHPLMRPYPTTAPQGGQP